MNNQEEQKILAKQTMLIKILQNNANNGNKAIILLKLSSPKMITAENYFISKRKFAIFQNKLII